MTTHPDCPWLSPSWDQCREEIAAERVPCTICPVAETLRQEQQQRRADAARSSK